MHACHGGQLNKCRPPTQRPSNAERAMLVDTFNMLTVFAKILLALGATILLFLDDATLLSLTGTGRDRSGRPSLLTEMCAGATFLASVILVAFWDSALAILVCMFLACWVLVQQKGRRLTASQTDAKVNSQSRAFAALSRAENTTQHLHPPPPLEQTMPMAYAMNDRSFSATT